MTLKKLLILFLLLAAPAAAKAQDKQYRFQIGDFTEVTVVDNLKVEYRCVPDSAGVAVFYANPAYVSDLSFDLKKSKLKIENDGEQPDSIFSNIIIYSSALTSATNWGDSTLTVVSPPPTAKFKAKVIGNGSVVVKNVQATNVSATVQAGNGRIFLSGKAHTASLRLMSVGKIEAGSLVASIVRCRMYGTGSIDCTPDEELSVAGLTSGTVYYKGNPNKLVNFAIGVHLIKVDAPND